VRAPSDDPRLPAVVWLLWLESWKGIPAIGTDLPVYLRRGGADRLIMIGAICKPPSIERRVGSRR
jgi:hypothetical protein